MAEMLVLNLKVLAVREVVSNVSGQKVDGKAVITQQSLGWFISLEGYVSIGVGMEKPDFVRGDIVEVTIRKRLPYEPARPSQPAVGPGPGDGRPPQTSGTTADVPDRPIETLVR